MCAAAAAAFEQGLGGLRVALAEERLLFLLLAWLDEQRWTSEGAVMAPDGKLVVLVPGTAPGGTGRR